MWWQVMAKRDKSFCNKPNRVYFAGGQLGIQYKYSADAVLLVLHQLSGRRL